MRIVSRAELVAMPSGVLFAEAFSCGKYGDLCIYSEYGGPDFLQRPIEWVESSESEDMWDREKDMWDNGTSYPVNTDYGREGYFDDTMKYLVYEPEDIASIFGELTE